VADQSIQLVVRRGPRPGQTFPLNLETVTLGRDPLSDIVINDPEVSRHHARFTLSGAGYELQDMGSTNGTFVDGKRLTGEPVTLHADQLLMFGSNVTLVYQATSGVDPMATMVGPGAMQAPQTPEPVPAAEEAEMPAEPVPVAEEPEMPAKPLPIAVEPEPQVEPIAVEPEPQVEPFAEEAADELELPESPGEEIVEMPEEEIVAVEDPGLATMMEGPIITDEVAAEPEPLPTFDEPHIQSEPLPTFDEYEPVDEPTPPPEAPTPVPSFEEPEPKPVFDSGEPLPDFEPIPAGVPPAEPISEIPAGDGPKDNKIGGVNRNIVIAAVVVVLLCCCCLLLIAAGLSLDSVQDAINF